jgi:very-short-patch-repair endonuclease
MAPAERLLWHRLRGKQFEDLKFRRQHGIGPYIVDFFCPTLRLAIELDGDTHATETREALDQQRDSFLTGLGVHVVRYQNRDVLSNAEAVLQDLTQRMKDWR